MAVTKSTYAVLARVSPGYPPLTGRSPTCYSPVRRSPVAEATFAHDLHVLSTPPAFILSQDQTLQFRSSPPGPLKPRQSYSEYKFTVARLLHSFPLPSFQRTGLAILRELQKLVNPNPPESPRRPVTAASVSQGTCPGNTRTPSRRWTLARPVSRVNPLLGTLTRRLQPPRQIQPGELETTAALSSSHSQRKGRKNNLPAATYSPTHQRVQYHRRRGA